MFLTPSHPSNQGRQQFVVGAYIVLFSRGHNKVLKLKYNITIYIFELSLKRGKLGISHFYKNVTHAKAWSAESY